MLDRVFKGVRFCVRGCLLLCVAGLLAAGCQGVGVQDYRDGAIQTAYRSTVQSRTESPGKGLVLSVPPFQESRRDRKERQNLWLSAVPVASCWAYWEQPDWLLWQESYYSTYKPAGRDLAEVFAAELSKSGLFGSVRVGDVTTGADLILKGDVCDLTLTMRPHFLGTSAWIGWMLGVVGLPMGEWTVVQHLDLRLVEAGSGKVVWEKTAETRDGGSIAAYYGRNPLQCGYPADKLLSPVVQEVIAEVEQVLASQGQSHWDDLVALRPAPSPAPTVASAIERPPIAAAGFPPRPRPTVGATGAVPAGVWAVCIGVSEYQDPEIPPLPYASKDARDMYALLTRQGTVTRDRARLLVDAQATKEAVDAALEGFLAKAGENDLILFYWSGHGFPDPADPEKVYFACHDTFFRKPYTGYRMDKVRDSLEEKNARHIVVFADTCHAAKLITRGTKGIAGVTVAGAFVGNQPLPRGTVLMVAAETDRKAVEDAAWSNGAFTHVLLRGMRGAADGFQAAGPQDGIITVGELRSYLASMMPEETDRVLGKALHPTIHVTTGDAAINSLQLVKTSQ